MTEEVQDNQTAPVQEAVEIPEKFRTEDGEINTEALLKSYTDLEKNRSQVVTEVDHLKKELESVKANADMAKTLEKIAENTAPVEDEKQSYEDYLTAQAEEMGLEPDDPAVKLNSLSAKAFNSWLQQDREALEEKHSKELAEIRGLIEADKASRVKESAEYKAHAQEIAEMVEMGIDEGKAIQFVLKKASQTSDVSAPPVSMPDGRVTATKSGDDYWATPEEKQKFVMMYGEEAAKEAEEAGKARLRRTAEEVV